MMKIKTRGDEVDITLGTRFVEVYAGSRFGPVVFMEATSEPVVDGDMASWMARNIVTGEMVSYGVNLKHWKYSPTLCHIDSVVFNEKIMPFRPWPIEVVSKGVFANNKKSFFLTFLFFPFMVSANCSSSARIIIFTGSIS